MQHSVIDYLERTAEKYADKTAVTDTETFLTYRQLQIKAKQIASYLLRKGICSMSIPIFAEKSVEAVCALWGIAYSGNYYTFLDTKQPTERIMRILSRLKAKLVLTDKRHYAKALSVLGNYPVVCMEEIPEQMEKEDFDRLESIRKGFICTDPLYINFTSGTTGEPKGVAVSHLSVIDFIDVFTETFDITSDEVIGNQAPFDFDVSVKDIFSCAATGASLVIIPRDYFWKPKEIMDYITEYKVTTIIWAVSAMCFLSTLKAFDYKVPAIRKIMFSGEVMPPNHLKIWRKYLPEAIYVNLYGPTEVTCNCTYYILEKNKIYEHGIPIGKAFHNERVLLLDDDENKIESSHVVGEICVAGIALALGYYCDEENTQHSFIQNPLNKAYKERLYRTGDMAWYDEDGNLYYSGRRDRQIKHLGHRIELNEIECAVNRELHILQSRCLYDEEKDRVVLFYTGGCDRKELQTFLKGTLPEYMLPSSYFELESFPMTKNGKVDDKELKNMYLKKKGAES